MRNSQEIPIPDHLGAPSDELDPAGVEAAARAVHATHWQRHYEWEETGDPDDAPPMTEEYRQRIRKQATSAITAYLQATPPREDGSTEREIERLQRVVRQQQQRLDDQGHGIQMTQHALTARNARIAELEALLEERDGDGVERPHSSGEPDGAGENPDGPLLVATTTQDSRDE